MDLNVELLKQQPFLNNVAASHLEMLLEGAKLETYAPGDYLIEEGKEANRLLLIQAGKIDIYTEKLDVTSNSESESIAIQHIKPGQILGWSWLLEPFKWKFDAQALEETKVISLDARMLRRRITEDHDFGHTILMELIKVISERLSATRIHLAIPGGKSFSTVEGG